MTSQSVFQSTHSVWSETLCNKKGGEAVGFQSTHSVWSETVLFTIGPLIGTFQSTHSVWSETIDAPRACQDFCISIHSLRVE